MTSYLTPEELEALQVGSLHRDAPFAITACSYGFFSIARHTGGAIWKSCHYTYNPVTDELIRDDVLKWIDKRRRVAAKQNQQVAASQQMGLGL